MTKEEFQKRLRMLWVDYLGLNPTAPDPPGPPTQPPRKSGTTLPTRRMSDPDSSIRTAGRWLFLPVLESAERLRADWPSEEAYQEHYLLEAASREWVGHVRVRLRQGWIGTAELAARLEDFPDVLRDLQQRLLYSYAAEDGPSGGVEPVEEPAVEEGEAPARPDRTSPSPPIPRERVEEVLGETAKLYPGHWTFVDDVLRDVRRRLLGPDEPAP